MKGPLLLSFPVNNKEDSLLPFLSLSTADAAPRIELLPVSLETLSPSQVLVCQSLRPNIYSFKSAQGKYLSSNSLGQVQCSKEAVGPSEEWQISLKSEKETTSDGLDSTSVSSNTNDSSNTTIPSSTISSTSRSQKFTVKSSLFGKWLHLSSGKVRADAEEEHPLTLYCQAALRKERLLKAFLTQGSSNSSSSTTANLSEYAQAETKKYSGLKTRIAMEDDLKAAAEEGSLREALLQKRIKAKHDPFC